MVATNPRNKKNYQISSLPIKTMFYTDESVTSWMIRAALNQGCDPLTFSQYYWSNYRLWTKDLDKGFNHFDKNISSDISKLAKIDIESFVNFHTFDLVYKRMSLESQQDIYKKHLSWIVPLAKRNRLRFLGYQYCPICFENQKEQPHLKIYWRFTWNIFCNLHKVLLQNKCPSCKEVYQPQLLHVTSRYINYCYNCKASLYFDKSQQSLDHTCIKHALSFQVRAHNAYLTGLGTILGQELQFKDWFETVLFFLNIIRKGKEKPNYMFGLLLKELNISLSETKNPIEPLSTNFLSSIMRCELFSTLELLIAVPKERWIKALAKHGISQNSFHWAKNTVIPVGFLSVYHGLPKLVRGKVTYRVSSGVKSKKTIANEWKVLQKKFKRMDFYEKYKL